MLLFLLPLSCHAAPAAIGLFAADFAGAGYCDGEISPPQKGYLGE